MHESLPRTIDYIEMPSCDLAETKPFFTSLFGWSFEDYGPDYAAFDDGRMAGGFFAAEKTWSFATACVSTHRFLRARARGKAAEVLSLGGKLTREIFAFPGGRRFHFQAPGTGELAVWSDQ